MWRYTVEAGIKAMGKNRTEIWKMADEGTLMLPYLPLEHDEQ